MAGLPEAAQRYLRYTLDPEALFVICSGLRREGFPRSCGSRNTGRARGLQGRAPRYEVVVADHLAAVVVPRSAASVPGPEECLRSG